MMRTDVMRKLVLPFPFATASRGDARDIYDCINRMLPTPVEFREVMENHPRERLRWAMALCEKITENDCGLSPQKTHNHHEQFLSDEECRVFRTNMTHRAKVGWDYVHAYPWRRRLSPDPFAETPEEAEARQKADIDRFRP